MNTVKILRQHQIHYEMISLLVLDLRQGSLYREQIGKSDNIPIVP